MSMVKWVETRDTSAHMSMVRWGFRGEMRGTAAQMSIVRSDERDRVRGYI
jgi:hypothetical protein